MYKVYNEHESSAWKLSRRQYQEAQNAGIYWQFIYENAKRRLMEHAGPGFVEQTFLNMMRKCLLSGITTLTKALSTKRYVNVNKG